MILSDYFLRRRVRSLLNHPISSKRKSCSFEKENCVLLFYRDTDREEVLSSLSKLTQKKNWRHVVFTEREDIKEEQTYTNTIWIKKSQLSIWAFPSVSVLDETRNIETNLLIDLTRDICYPLLYLFLKHPAGMKVGLKKSLDDIYDFTLSVNKKEKIAYIFQQIVFYLQTICRK